MRTENDPEGRKRPPDTAEDVLTELTDRFDDFSDQLQIAARYLIDRPREVGVHSMRALAAKAEVHPNTLVRLAQAIGFDGYDGLRSRFRDFVASGGIGGFGDRAAWLQDLRATCGTGAILSQMAETTASNVDDMWRSQSAEVFDQISDAILKADKVYVLGMGSAYSLAHQFWYVARMAFEHIAPIPRHGSQPIDDLAWLTPRDAVMALTFQAYRSETIEAVRHARQVGATVIGVTDSRTSPLARLSDHLLTAPTHTPQFFQSHAAVVAMLDGLLAALVARGGAEAAARIAAFHARRLAAGIYEESAPLAQISLGDRQ